jgi:hypothetical protein
MFISNAKFTMVAKACIRLFCTCTVTMFTWKLKYDDNVIASDRYKHLQMNHTNILRKKHGSFNLDWNYHSNYDCCKGWASIADWMTCSLWTRLPIWPMSYIMFDPFFFYFTFYHNVHIHAQNIKRWQKNVFILKYFFIY